MPWAFMSWGPSISASSRPNLEEARLAIDALGALVEGLENRLGEHEATLKDALHQIRMAFVQVSRAMEGAAEDAEDSKEDDAGG